MREIEVSQGVRPIGVTVLRGRTEAVVLRQLKRLQRRGYIYAASPVSRINRRAGGGYAVKVSLLRELPEPYPAWAKGIIAVGLSLTGMALLVILVWHLYCVLLRPGMFPLDRSIFTGRISHERMAEEHPLELEASAGAGARADVDPVRPALAAA